MVISAIPNFYDAHVFMSMYERERYRKDQSPIASNGNMGLNKCTLDMTSLSLEFKPTNWNRSGKTG